MSSDYERGEAYGRSLVGTATGLSAEAGTESSDFLAGLDDTALCCGSCGYWAESDEINDQGECYECRYPHL